MVFKNVAQRETPRLKLGENEKWKHTINRAASLEQCYTLHCRRLTRLWWNRLADRHLNPTSSLALETRERSDELAGSHDLKEGQLTLLRQGKPVIDYSFGDDRLAVCHHGFECCFVCGFGSSVTKRLRCKAVKDAGTDDRAGFVHGNHHSHNSRPTMNESLRRIIRLRF